MIAHSASAIVSHSFFLDTTLRSAERKPSKASLARRWIFAMVAARQRQADKRLAGYLRAVQNR
jgi:hypothetical protein